MSGIIKRRNLKPYVLQWLTNKLELGLSIGRIFYVSPSTTGFYQNLLDNGVPTSEIFASLVAGEDALRDGYNDVLCVAPGIITATAATTWDKSSAHLVGLAGPQNKGYEVGTGFYSSGITVANLINNTGTRNQFHNITLMNAGGNAACLSAFRNGGSGTRLIGCQIIGCAETATQGKTALANSLAIDSGGYYFYAENCSFGSTDFGALGANTACVLLFAADGMCSDGKFVACNFSAMIDATTRTFIYIETNGIDRDWIFDCCEFYAFSTNHAYAMAQVVTNQAAVPSTYDMTFKDCSAINVTAYRTASNGCTWASGGGAAAAKTGVAIVTT